MYLTIFLYIIIQLNLIEQFVENGKENKLVITKPSGPKI